MLTSLLKICPYLILGSELFDQIRSAGHSIDILINNAGYGRWGEFTSHERDDYLKMVQLNITTLTDLCHLYIPDMITRGVAALLTLDQWRPYHQFRTQASTHHLKHTF